MGRGWGVGGGRDGEGLGSWWRWCVVGVVQFIH